MFLPKAVYAQIANICYERERRGVPAYEMRMGKEQIYTIPMGAICFIPDLALLQTDPVPQYARIQDEPILIATDNADEFVYVSKNNGGDIQMINIVDEMEPNCSVDGEDEYYVLVVHGLNFCFSDAIAPPLKQQQDAITAHPQKAVAHSQKVAEGLAPAKRKLPFL